MSEVPRSEPAAARMLAIETSTRYGSIALCLNGSVVTVSELPRDQRTAQCLAPALDTALRRVGWTPERVDLVALTNGPGSFTGLRIAVTTAKAFAYAVRARVVALNTLDVIVNQLPSNTNQACAVMNAQRNQMFAAWYQRGHDGVWQVTRPCQIMDLDSLLGDLSSDTTVTGPGLQRLADQLPPGVSVADSSRWHPDAAMVGQVGWTRYQKGQHDDLWSLVPQYFRPSYAEESTR